MKTAFVPEKNFKLPPMLNKVQTRERLLVELEERGILVEDFFCSQNDAGAIAKMSFKTDLLL